MIHVERATPIVKLNLKLQSYVIIVTDILVKGDIAIVGAGGTNAARKADRNYKQAIFKNCVLFTNYISEVNNKQVDNAKDLDVVMPIYKLIEYSDCYSNKSVSLYQFCRDVPYATITDSESFKFKSILLDTKNAGTINAEIAVKCQI